MGDKFALRCRLVPSTATYRRCSKDGLTRSAAAVGGRLSSPTRDSKVISITEREGPHTLDAIVLADDAPEIHTAGTHGATELVFAGFDLLGRRSSRASMTWPTSRSTASDPAKPDLPPTRC